MEQSTNTNSTTRVELSGSIERITYHNIENGFCVLRVNVKGRKDLVTVIGSVPSISIGEHIEFGGLWHNDKKHGLQVKADSIKALPPSSLEGIEKYLGSGLIKGIGPHFAKKLIKKFGSEVFNIIEHQPDLLLTVENIGQHRARNICANWKEQKVVRDIMVFLQSHGVSTARATRIYRTYGDKAIEIVSENPYKLANDIRGIGFVIADTIAGNLGIAKNSLIRARAGLHHALLEGATSEGHCGLPRLLLIEKACELLGVHDTLIEEAIMHEVDLGVIIKDSMHQGVDSIFPANYHTYEKNLGQAINALKEGVVSWGEMDIPTETMEVESKLKITLADVQKIALSKALTTKLMVITGGPGTGKTTLVNSILTILKSKKLKIKLCAPTGRAARRLSETTGLEATTIHRLLEIDPIYGGFKRNANNKLDCDYLVIDEVSMVDVSLFHSLMQAMPDNAALLLVGDVDQLPSVGAGQVLKDIIDSEVVEVVKLTEIFRQAATSDIITNAHMVNNGILPNLESAKDVVSDFYFIPAEAGENLMGKLLEVVTKRIPTKFGFHPVRDIQILTPMQKSGTGARSLNIELQKVLNPGYESGVMKFGEYFAKGDKVMQTENNYDKEIYNGDIGEIKTIDSIEKEVVIGFYGRDITYDYSDLDQITLAYATTIHKSQGSEYPVVIIPLTTQSFRMLQRNLIYTAITRGKKLVVIIGEKKALDIAVNNVKSLSRYSKLKEWLRA